MSRSSAPFEGSGSVWSSHPCRNPRALNAAAFTEILALMHWDERFARAFRRATKEYIAAGSPGVPMNSVNYRKTHAKTAVLLGSRKDGASPQTTEVQP